MGCRDYLAKEAFDVGFALNIRLLRIEHGSSFLLAHPFVQVLLQFVESLSLNIAGRLVDDGREMSEIVHDLFHRQKVQAGGEYRRLDDGVSCAIKAEEAANVTLSHNVAHDFSAILRVVD